MSPLHKCSGILPTACPHKVFLISRLQDLLQDSSNQYSQHCQNSSSSPLKSSGSFCFRVKLMPLSFFLLCRINQKSLLQNILPDKDLEYQMRPVCKRELRVHSVS